MSKGQSDLSYYLSQFNSGFSQNSISSSENNTDYMENSWRKLI